MRTSALVFRLFVLATLSGASLLHAASKDLSSSSQDVVIVRPANLPALAQSAGQALYLKRVASTEETYLYVEQNSGAQLAVFDVSDPGKIRALRPVALGAAEPFDFVKYLGRDAVLVRYRGSRGYALLDARKATAPVLRAASSEIYGGDLHRLGADAYLQSPSNQTAVAASAEDYRIVDLARPEQPVVLYTAKGVVDTLTRPETETTFLLGADGLTVVRHPRAEAEFAASQNTWN